ncbi:glycosyltransferase [Microbacterium halotolerans]|uniref:glycosyltransferase n=1 Tax=Microbacterium halotolerans TaxID=246613 RepID=UPI000E6AAC94|nr:glycosyltransferase [Microbacterium halotolerans]
MGLGKLPDRTGYPLQAAIWPQAGISTETEAHFALKGSVGISLSEGGADFAQGGRLATGTYYNLFNLGKWRRNSGDLPLELQLTGHGRFLLSIHVACRNRSTQQLFSEVVTLDGLLRQPFDPYEEASSDAIVFFKLTALEDGRLEDFAWATTEKPRSTPDLLLSVTTFRREAEVASTAERFRRFRAESELNEHIRMVIVDNGQSATVDDGDGVTVIPNENLGGSGGFTRGLLEARATNASHVLFMDDDASIQMEAVSRTWWFLAYAQDPRTAVAGAMVHDAKRWQIGENGAHFDLGCKAHYAGLDLRQRKKVFRMEYETTAPARGDFYAGWWFFAFPVAQVEHLPFPFFVRGDDVSFSLVNDFNTFTLPGVASVQESFVDKASPQTWYLDFRSHLIHHLSLPEKKRSWKELQRMVLNFYLRTALRFHYDTLSAVNLAFEDVMRGPDFFDKNADMAKRRGDIKAMTTTEVWQPIASPPKPRRTFLPRPVRALLLLTLNGHLLPLGMAKVVLPAESREDFRLIYGAKEITHLNVDQTQAYTVRRDPRRFRKETLRLLKNTLRLRRIYPKMLREWSRGYDGLTSNAYWNDKLRLEQQGS